MTAQTLFNGIFNASLVIMIITLVMSLGMSFTVAQVLAPMRRTGFLLGAIAVNSVLAPLIAIGVAHLFPLTSQARTGLEIVTIAAAGPAGLKACQLAKRADMAMAVSFTIVLQVLNIIAAPLWAKAVVTGAKVNPWTIVVDLLILVLIPLVIGLIVRARYAADAGKWKTGLEKTSNIALYVVIGVGIGVNWKLVVTSVGSWVILASAVIIVIYILLGWAPGIGHRQSAVTISMVSAMRFTPIGLIVISTVLHNQGAYLTPALIFALVDTIIPFVVAAEIGRFLTRGDKPAAPGAGPKPAPAAAAGQT